jgi:TPR repeat protein
VNQPLAKQVAKETIAGVEQKAKAGDAVAMNLLAFMSLNGLTGDRNIVEAEKWLLLSAKQDYALAQYNLGVLFANRTDGYRNREEALKWYRKSADQGFPLAQAQLGFEAYSRNPRNPQNDLEALEWFRKASKAGNAQGHYCLGLMYTRGQGAKMPASETIRLWTLAANQGWGLAQFDLGQCYERGIGVAKDPARAADWYRKAAAQGHPGGQQRLRALAGGR